MKGSKGEVIMMGDKSPRNKEKKKKKAEKKVVVSPATPIDAVNKPKNNKA